MDIKIVSSNNGYCYLVDDGDSALLLDAGVSKVRLKEAVRWNRNVIGCLVSHKHRDHAKGVHNIIEARIPCFANVDTAQAIRCAKAPKRQCDLVNVYPFDNFKIGSWSIIPFDAPHDVQNLGFCITSEKKKRLLYATDMCQIKYKFRGITHLMVECHHQMSIVDASEIARNSGKRYRNHMSLERLCRWLQRINVSTIQETWILHLSPIYADPKTIFKEIRRVIKTPILIPEV